ncbi:hypothetical protein CEUSTIGMA_g1775.t1 [Chlamydomonas eustigma]|uniref:DUF3598 domain-containing protein n=1 Tax=Chlamydomonas eustigma TaxID=1157962 RepID=A0A250WU84_9CHLO|nr:hypothetical protein CEUSTIGMA_g1775.t1 [Chlamydomonas eustigma]|eukprot:GAX74326.1 hypothetical protein CEUSTIGMA_g1775.t1 [Chlamydomonas eustigma]
MHVPCARAGFKLTKLVSNRVPYCRHVSRFRSFNTKGKGNDSPFESSGFGRRDGASKNGKARKGRQGSSKKQDIKKDLTISVPIQVTLLEEGKSEMTESPIWATFCNHVSGEWIGQYGAYTPWEGKPEPVWINPADNKYKDWVFSRCVEYRGSDEDGDDKLIRKMGRATTLEALKALPLSTEGLDVVEDIDVEALSYNSEGVVVFTGGHYSAGPDYIGLPNYKILQQDDDEEESAAEADDHVQSVKGKGEQSTALGEGQSKDAGDDEDEGAASDSKRVQAPTSTSIVEQCLMDWGSHSRMRVKTTLRIGHDEENGEVDVSILRVLVIKEFWSGMPSTMSPAMSSSPSKGLSIASATSSTPSSQVKILFDETVVLPPLAAGEASTSHSTSPSSSSANPPPTSDRTTVTKTSSISTGAISTSTDFNAHMTMSKWFPKPCVELPRPSLRAVNGNWSCFTISAVAIEEEDPLTGVESVNWVYSSMEDKQEWQLQSQSSNIACDLEDKGAPKDGEDGGVLWLPGGIMVSFRMVEFQNDEEEPQDTEGEVSQHHLPGTLKQGIKAKGMVDKEALSRPPRGLCIGLTWMHTDGQALQVERYYDGEGVLRDVRHTSAVKGGWSGGSM